MDYKNKYLKYKNKYLLLKNNQIGGVLPQNFNNFSKLNKSEIDNAIRKTQKNIEELNDKISRTSDDHELNEILLNIEKNNLELRYIFFLQQLKEIGKPNEHNILQYSKILNDNENIFKEIGTIQEKISSMEYEIKQKEVKQKLIKKFKLSQSQYKNQTLKYNRSPGDGNCQFHSILRSANDQGIELGELQIPFQLKKLVIQYIQLYGLDATLQKNLQYADYGHINMSKYNGRELIRQVNNYFSQPNSFGNYISLLALNTMLDIQINVYHNTKNGYEILFVVGNNQDRQVNILYNGDDHYDWLSKN
jgi:hypothetical protein